MYRFKTDHGISETPCGTDQSNAAQLAGYLSWVGHTVLGYRAETDTQDGLVVTEQQDGSSRARAVFVNAFGPLTLTPMGPGGESTILNSFDEVAAALA
jgi:hypothetical protein